MKTIDFNSRYKDLFDEIIDEYEKSYKKIIANQTSSLLSTYLDTKLVTGYKLDIKNCRECIETIKGKIYLKDGVITKTTSRVNH